MTTQQKLSLRGTAAQSLDIRVPAAEATQHVAWALAHATTRTRGVNVKNTAQGPGDFACEAIGIGRLDFDSTV